MPIATKARVRRLSVIVGFIACVAIAFVAGLFVEAQYDDEDPPGVEYCVVTKESEPFRQQVNGAVAGQLVRGDPGSGCSGGEYLVCGLPTADPNEPTPESFTSSSCAQQFSE